MVNVSYTNLRSIDFTIVSSICIFMTKFIFPTNNIKNELINFIDFSTHSILKNAVFEFNFIVVVSFNFVLKLLSLL